MGRLLSWIVMIPAALVMVDFAAVNRTPIALDLWPLPWAGEVASWVVVLVAVALGVVAGWVPGILDRRRARHLEKRLKLCERDLAGLRDELAEARAQGSDAAP